MEAGLLKLADRSVANFQYDAGVAVYLHILSSDNHELRPAVRQKLISALHNWSELIKNQDSDGTQLLLKGFCEAVKLFPTCSKLLSNFGGLMFKLGYSEESLGYFRRSLAADPDFLKAQENLDNVLGHLVERWHFRMLNDNIRNVAYRRAIDAAVQRHIDSTGQQPNVLDIGAGTGLLGMFAAQSLSTRCRQPATVYGCEMSTPIYKMAVDIVRASSVGHGIKLINKKSLDLCIKDDLPNKINLVVTETFDCALLGEHVLGTLCHAYTELIDSSSPCTVIPRAATVFVSAIESRSLRVQNRYLGNDNGLDTSSVRIVSALARRFLGICDDLTDITDDVTGDQDDDETYTSERLSGLRFGYRLLSTPTAVASMDFNNRSEVLSYAAGTKKSLSLKIKSSGHVDALVVWFDLDLGSDITISTSPLSGGDMQQTICCWEQAVYPVIHHDDLLPDNYFVDAGNSLDISIELDHLSLSLDCRKINRTSPTVQNGNHRSHNSAAAEDNTSPSHSSSDAVVSSPPLPPRLFFLSPSSIARLNDTRLVAACVEAVRSLQLRHENVSRTGNLRLAVVSSDLVLFPILALRLNLVSDVCFIDLERSCRPLVSRLLAANEIADERVVMCDAGCSDVVGEWDVLYADVVDGNGILRQDVFDDICAARTKLLSRCGVLLPCFLKVFGVVVHSLSLLGDTSVIADRQMEFGENIAVHFNDFRTKSHVDVELSTLCYAALSEPLELLTIDVNDLTKPPAAMDAATDLDCFPAQRVIENTVCFNALRTDAVTAVVYWFEITLTPDVAVTTRDLEHHWSQAAILFYDETSVIKDAEYRVRTVCSHSRIDVSLNAL